MDEISNVEQNNQYSLSIRFSSDGFSLCVYDISGYQVSQKKMTVPLFFSLSKNEIQEIIAHDTSQLLIYDNISLICESDTYTFIPSQFLEHGNVADFLLLEHQISPKDCVLNNEISSWQIVNVFSIPQNLDAALATLYPSIKIEHHLSYMLTHHITQRNETAIYIWVRSKIMDVIVLINGSLHLVNSFNYLTPEDFTYYTLNIFDQLALNTDMCKVRLFNTRGSTELQKMIQKYLKLVEVIN